MYEAKYAIGANTKQPTKTNGNQRKPKSEKNINIRTFSFKS